jgi:SEC-C motif-containing protein
MRSRYSAYAVGDTGYVWRTWHPRTRPERIDPDPSIAWTGLEILESTEDTVEFRAHHGSGILHERSRFEQRAGQWFYLDGTVVGG